jgi:hypothetical protein
MLYREIIAVCSEIHTKHLNTLCGQNVIFFSVKPVGTYSDHWVLEREWGKTGYDTIERDILDDKGRVRYSEMLWAVLFKRAEIRKVKATCLKYRSTAYRCWELFL